MPANVRWDLIRRIKVIRAQPDDGQRNAPKHVVVARHIANYILLN